MVIKTGRFGKFISCTGYPECKTTKPIVKDTGAKCPKDGGMIVERKSEKGRTFYGCANYPEMRFRFVGSRGSRAVPGLRYRTSSRKHERGGDVLAVPADKEHDMSAHRGARRPTRRRDEPKSRASKR